MRKGNILIIEGTLCPFIINYINEILLILYMSDFNNLKKSDEISLLTWPMAIRTRLGMYLGDADREGLNTCAKEIVSNALDEVYQAADQVVIDRNFNGLMLVADNGRGISIEYSKDCPDKISADLSISALHSGSKFNKNVDSNGNIVVSTGLHGVGSSAVCAVSDIYVLCSRITPLNYDKSSKEVLDLWNSCGPRSKKDLFYIVVYKRGIKSYEGALKKSDIEKMLFGNSGQPYRELPTGMSTIVMFTPDPTIFENSQKMELPMDDLRYFLLIQEKFFKKKVGFWVEGQDLTASGFTGYGNEFTTRIVPADNSENPYVDVYVSFGVDTDLGKKELHGSVNSLKVESGVHLSYVEDCFSKAIKQHYGIKHKYTTNGLKMCVVVLAAEVLYSSQTKEKLKSISKVKPSDFDPLVKEFIKIFKKDPESWDLYAEKLNILADSMKNLSAVEKIQKMVNSTTGNSLYKMKSDVVDGFSDATSPVGQRWDCELFLCEGLSPAGSLKAGRHNTKYHAVLPLKGKVLNVSEKSLDQALANKEIFTIFKMIGLGLDVNNVTTGCTSPEEAYEKIQKFARYGKICIATDADSDGSQIASLILYLFSKYARFLIDFGMVYISEGPLYRDYQGKYFYPSDPFVPGTNFPVGLDTTKKYARYKGLGSIPKEYIYDAYFNPATRRLIQITPDNIDYAMSLTEDITVRKALLRQSGILSNPFNFTDII